jgi:hypothetical protein
LLGVLDECGEWADVGKARRAVAFLDARAESPFESMSRATMHEHGVPTPELQKVLTGASGIGYRVDFYWEAGRLIGEADGRQKYRDDDRRRAEEIVWAEKQREDDLREAGYDFVRWTYRQMFREAALTAARINRKLLTA